MTPIPATEVPVAIPQPPPRPEIQVVAWPSWSEVLEKWLWHVELCHNPQTSHNLKKRGAALFVLPPANPAASDWRSGCLVRKCNNNRWDVYSPDRARYLTDETKTENKWRTITEQTDLEYGLFLSERSARAALSIAPVPPGVTQ